MTDSKRTKCRVAAKKKPDLFSDQIKEIQKELQALRKENILLSERIAALEQNTVISPVSVPPPVTEEKTAFEYLKIYDGISIKHYTGLKLESLLIPEKIENYSVTEIGDFAFMNCFFLKKVQLPQTLKRIRSFAFFGCSAMKSIEIPQGVISIGDSAFLRLLDSVSIGYLQKIYIPDSVKSIADNAFCADPATTSDDFKPVIYCSMNSQAMRWAQMHCFPTCSPERFRLD